MGKADASTFRHGGGPRQNVRHAHSPSLRHKASLPFISLFMFPSFLMTAKASTLASTHSRRASGKDAASRLIPASCRRNTKDRRVVDLSVGINVMEANEEHRQRHFALAFFCMTSFTSVCAGSTLAPSLRPHTPPRSHLSLSTSCPFAGFRSFSITHHDPLDPFSFPPSTANKQLSFTSQTIPRREHHALPHLPALPPDPHGRRPSGRGR